MSLDIGDVYFVAECLASEHSEIPALDWDNIPQGRWRSTISRAYYGVLLDVKEIVRQELPTFTFPKRGVHSILRNALNADRFVSVGLRNQVYRLRTARESADYEPLFHYAYEAATDAIDNAESVRAQLLAWPPQTRKGFALAFQKATVDGLQRIG